MDSSDDENAVDLSSNVTNLKEKAFVSIQKKGKPKTPEETPKKKDRGDMSDNEGVKQSLKRRNKATDEDPKSKYIEIKSSSKNSTPSKAIVSPKSDVKNSVSQITPNSAKSTTATYSGSSVKKSSSGSTVKPKSDEQDSTNLTEEFDFNNDDGSVSGTIQDWKKKKSGNLGNIFSLDDDSANRFDQNKNLLNSRDINGKK